MRFRLRLLPVPGQQLIDLGCTVIRQTTEDIGEPGPRIDIIELTGFHQRVHHSGAQTAICPAKGKGTGLVMPYCDTPAMQAQQSSAALMRWFFSTTPDGICRRS